MSQERLTPSEENFEARLAGLSPAGAAGRDQLLYQAGLQQARRRYRPLLAAMVVLFVAAAAAALWPRTPQVQIVERVVEKPVYVTVAPTPPAPQGPALPTINPSHPPDTLPLMADGSYIRLRQAVLEKGLDALPREPSGGGQAQTLWQSRKTLGM